MASATMLVVGSVIGSGIFLTPGLIAADVPNGWLIMAAWVVGGLFSLAVALTFAELGSMYPRAGGQYVFLSKAFGPGAAFLFGWMALVVNYSGTVAAVAVAFATFLGVLLGFSGYVVKFVAIGCIWGLTLVNIIGVRHGGAVQNVATVTKVAALAALVFLAFLVGPRVVVLPDLGVGPANVVTLSGFFLAVTAVLFAFDGLGSCTFVGEEVKDAGRIVPRATIAAALIVTLVYLAVNGAFLRLLPIETMAGSELVAADAGRALFGSNGARLAALAIIISTFGTVNGYILQSPRIYYAMARDGALYGGFGRTHPRFATPVFGLVLQAEWSSLLVLSGTFDQLITYVIMSSTIFFALTGVALFVLRRKEPDRPRPYRTWGYPVVPALFVLMTLVIVGNSLLYDTRNALIGVLLALSGIPVYWFMRRYGPATSDS